MHSRSHAPYLTLAALFALLSCALYTSPAHAKGFDDDWEPPPDHRAYSKEFNGTFTDISARYGFARARRSRYTGRSIDAGLRISFPAYVGDLRLSYRNDLFTPDNTQTNNPVTMHSMGVGLGLHPAYLLVLGSDWLSYIASGFYFDLGFGGQFGSIAIGDTRDRDFGLYGHAGAGLDIPLWDPDVGFALWLNLLYRYHHGDYDLNLAGGERTSIALQNHTAFIGISARINRLFF
ncbi:MAG: hypothetical protein VYE40_11570 [Myxococcota bacterium]|nr:hypothetical protein [Myxococcota bacterium]MEC9441734.1 hypothetical protein [Myxococcota bacterium]